MFKASICFRELPTTSGINPVPLPRSTTYSTSSREEKNGYEVAPGFDQVLEEKRYKGRLSSGYPSEDILETRYGGRISPPPRRHYESPSEYQHTDSGYPSTSPVRIIIIHFIVWLALRVGKMNQIRRCDWLPEQARRSHLARSGLPALSFKKNFPKSHIIIINPLLTKLVQSRWLDIGLVLFLRVYGP